MKWFVRAVVVGLFLHATCFYLDTDLPPGWYNWREYRAFNRAVTRHGLNHHMYMYWREKDGFYYVLLNGKKNQKAKKLF
jgi:hypothetical protein